MDKRLKPILYKLNTLREQVVALEVAVAANRLSKESALFRLNRVQNLLSDYEDRHQQLLELAPDHERAQELNEIQETFYEVGARIQAMPSAGGSAAGATGAVVPPPPVAPGPPPGVAPARPDDSLATSSVGSDSVPAGSGMVVASGPRVDVSNGSFSMSPVGDSVSNRECILAGTQHRGVPVVSPAATVGGSVVTPQLLSSSLFDRQSAPKLPTAKLPQFDGKLDEWLEFRNVFLTLIDSRTDLSPSAKFIHLRDSLKGEAKAKIALLLPCDENYKKAWDRLVAAYERKRALANRYLDEILNLGMKVHVTAAEITALQDQVRQHMSMLELLGRKAEPDLTMRCVERGLSDSVRAKWEEQIGLNEMPDLEKLFDFMSLTVHQMQASERNEMSRASNPKRCPTNEPFRQLKRRRNEPAARVLVTAPVTKASGFAAPKCLACKAGSHALFRCHAFLKMSVQQRYALLKGSAVCYNCFLSHPGKQCTYRTCDRCSKRHNRLLHRDAPGAHNGGRGGALEATSAKDSVA